MTTPAIGWPGRLVVAAAFLYPLAFVVVALLRIGHPFELEWMEGGMVEHVRRILDGQPLYVAPSLEFTPFIYPPLYFQISALAARVLGPGFVPLRLVSLISTLACLVLIYRIVRWRGQASWAPALVGAALFAACYREGGAWLDLARVDPLFLALTLAGIDAARREGLITAIVAGVCLALAALTKQTALFIALPLGVAVLATAPRRGAVLLAVLALVAGGIGLWLDQSSDGWFRYYVLQLPRDHPIIPQLRRGFWTDDLLGPVGIALAIGTAHFFARPDARQAWRGLAVDAVVVISLLLTAYATKIRVGSFDNLVLPAHVAAALTLGWGLDALLAAGATASAATRARGERWVAVLVLAQLAVLAYKPWKQIPPAEHRVAGEQFVASLKRVPGEVWVPAHGYLARMAGKKPYAHELALVDVLRPGDTPVQRRLLDEIRSAISSHRFDLVVLDHEGWLKELVTPNYHLYARMFGDNEKTMFWSLTGYYTRPDFVWAPGPAPAGGTASGAQP